MKPDGLPILGMDPVSGPGKCQVCMIQNGTGADVDSAHNYEIWVRDTNDGNSYRHFSSHRLPCRNEMAQHVVDLEPQYLQYTRSIYCMGGSRRLAG